MSGGSTGFVGFVRYGEKYIQKVEHAYPSTVGIDMLRWARSVEDWDEIAGTVYNTVRKKPTKTVPPNWVDELLQRGLPARALAHGETWSDVLRISAGDPRLTLQLKVIAHEAELPYDSETCVWGYLFDLDDGDFELYHGYNRAQTDHGFFYRPVPNARGWWPVERVRIWKLSKLPSDEDFLKVAEPRAMRDLARS